MATLWIIDAYNFIRGSKRFADWEASDPEQGRREALRWLGRFAEMTGERLRVVFDAYSGYQREPTTGRQFSLEIWGSRGSTTADEEILEMAREFKEACVVISSDREVQRGAIQSGASILSVLEFEREVEEILHPQGKEDSRQGRNRGNAFRPPREKKRAYFLLRKYQKS